MAHLVITIGCEYGAKGNRIGRKVASDLGIKFYDRDTVDEIIKEVGIPKDIMEKVEQGVTIAGKGAEGDTRGAFSKYADLTERAIHVQKTIIRKLAARESCSSSRRLSTARWTIWTARCSRLPAPAVRSSPFSRSRNHGFRQAVPAAG